MTGTHAAVQRRRADGWSATVPPSAATACYASLPRRSICTVEITCYNSTNTIEVLCDWVHIELIDITDRYHVTDPIRTACNPATVCAFGCRHDIFAVVP